MQRLSHRGVIIALLFAFWLGAAALACGPFFSDSIGADAQSSSDAQSTPSPVIVSAHVSNPHADPASAEMASAHARP